MYPSTSSQARATTCSKSRKNHLPCCSLHFQPDQSLTFVVPELERFIAARDEMRGQNRSLLEMQPLARRLRYRDPAQAASLRRYQDRRTCKGNRPGRHGADLGRQPCHAEGSMGDEHAISGPALDVRVTMLFSAIVLHDIQSTVREVWRNGVVHNKSI